MLCAHGLLLIALLGNYWIDRPALRRRPIAVRTIPYAPPKPVAAETSVHVKPAPKKVEKAAIKPKIAPKNPTSDAALKQIAKSLDALAVKPAPIVKQELAIPQMQLTLEHLPEEEVVAASEQIACFLQETLQLPDYGEVKAHLVINRFGRLETLEILEAKSAKNEQFLKNRLPELQFPCLNESASLTIVFRNAL